MPMGFRSKILGHLEAAKAGDRDRESALINRLGQLRRHYLKIGDMPDFLIDAVKQAVAFLRSVGRTVDLGNPDPAKWVSRRGGSPRW